MTLVTMSAGQRRHIGVMMHPLYWTVQTPLSNVCGVWSRKSSPADLYRSLYYCVFKVELSSDIWWQYGQRWEVSVAALNPLQRRRSPETHPHLHIRLDQFRTSFLQVFVELDSPGFERHDNAASTKLEQADFLSFLDDDVFAAGIRADTYDLVREPDGADLRSPDCNEEDVAELGRREAEG